jgi:hypothetical protein
MKLKQLKYKCFLIAIVTLGALMVLAVLIPNVVVCASSA